MLDAETSSHGWDARLWPIGRLCYVRKFTTSGVERRLGIYRICRWDRVVWWRSG